MSHAGNGITRPAPGISEGMGAGDRRPPARKKHLRPVRTAGPPWSGANGPFRQSIFHRFSDVSTVAPSADCLRSRRIGVGRLSRNCSSGSPLACGLQGRMDRRVSPSPKKRLPCRSTQFVMDIPARKGRLISPASARRRGHKSRSGNDSRRFRHGRTVGTVSGSRVRSSRGTEAGTASGASLHFPFSPQRRKP